MTECWTSFSAFLSSMSRRRVLLKKAGNPAQYTLRDQRNSFSSVHVSPAHYAYAPWAEDDGTILIKRRHCPLPSPIKIKQSPTSLSK
ncbi:MAG: hypothetical protein IPP74_00460 [Alphaproteobacteria bacterium]|nr:hypothetical protein [Alphaproteobacteria bacterium]